MTIQVQRQAAWSSDKSTMGALSINGLFYCYTLEPPMKTTEGQAKPYAIPSGTYQVRLEESPHFTELMARSSRMRALFEPLFPDGRVITPHLYGVPDFESVEIHPGNIPEDTDGCTLVGEDRAADFVGASDLAFRTLMRRLLAANDQILGTYVDPIAAV